MFFALSFKKLFPQTEKRKELSELCLILDSGHRYESFSITEKLLIKNAYFSSLTGERGGAIYISSSCSTLIDNSVFTNCSATSSANGFGGAFDIELIPSSSNKECDMIMNSCCISECTAAAESNAIYTTTDSQAKHYILQTSFASVDNIYSAYLISCVGGNQFFESVNVSQCTTYKDAFLHTEDFDKVSIEYSNIINSFSLYSFLTATNPNSSLTISKTNFYKCNSESQYPILLFTTEATEMESISIIQSKAVWTLEQTTGILTINNCVFEEFTYSGSVSYSNVETNNLYTQSHKTTSNSISEQCYVPLYDDSNFGQLDPNAGCFDSFNHYNTQN